MPEQPPSQVAPPSRFMTQLMDEFRIAPEQAPQEKVMSINSIMKRDGGATWLGGCSGMACGVCT